jgi:hypothetical protein
MRLFVVEVFQDLLTLPCKIVLEEATDVQQNPSTRLRTRLFRGIVAVVALTMFIAAVATSHVSFVFLGLAALLFLAMRID